MLIDERRAILRHLVQEYGIDLIAVYTSRKNEAKTSKNMVLFKENKTKILEQNLTSADYVRKIDAGVYDDGCAIACGLIRCGKYEGYKIALLDIDKKQGLTAFLDYGDSKRTIEEISEEQYIEFNGRDKDCHLHIPIILDPDANITEKGADDELGIEVNVNGVMFGFGSPHHNGDFYQQLGNAGVEKIKRW